MVMMKVEMEEAEGGDVISSVRMICCLCVAVDSIAGFVDSCCLRCPIYFYELNFWVLLRSGLQL